ncbi:MAG: ABC transporter ATP-binding protein [Desulfobacca sp.]|uniref:ABC transporter ATP-binding protein n=1 Tax=Desulfobacca sp. TaxID=2067990 RepID=UPI00404933EA
MVAAQKQALLELCGIDVTWGSQRLLQNIAMQVAPQEIVGIIGPNGAGKTTLMGVIGGQVLPTRGRVFYQGQDMTSWPPHRRCREGIARTFQIPRPFVEMTAWENVAIGLRFGRGRPPAGSLREQALPLLELVGLTHKADTLGRDLTLSEQRRLEVARALATEPQIVLLDEVAAGLSPKMVRHVVALVGKLRQQGLTLLIIDHFLNLTLEVADRLVVLDRGEKIMEGPPPEVMRHPEVVGAYLGTRRPAKAPPATGPTSASGTQP